MKKIGILGLFVLLLLGCSSKQDEFNSLIDKKLTSVESSLNTLQSALDGNRVSNAILLKDYARQLKSSKPQYSELIDNLAQNALSDGLLYRSLQDRFKAVKQKRGETLDELISSVEELDYIEDASKVSIFNDALTDPVNVLADLSKGELPRVNSLSREAEQAANKSSGEVGSQLVGNPQYGKWTSDSRGMSFWEWYGMYSLFSHFTDGRRSYYHSWSSNRPYSYYHDYGRSRYSWPKDKRAQNQVEQKTRKSFQSRGKKFSSPYAKQRVGGSQLSSASKAKPSSGSFRQASNYRKSTTSSSRRSSSRTSRGPRRGK